jgi:hypothetical protein
MSDKSNDLGTTTLLVISVLVVVNFDRAIYKFSRYWDRHIAPTIEALFLSILWIVGAALIGLLTWRLAIVLHKYVSARMIIVRAEYLKLLKEVTDLRRELTKSQDDAWRYEDLARRKKQEVEALSVQLKKATQRPEAIIDKLVTDIVGGK